MSHIDLATINPEIRNTITPLRHVLVNNVPVLRNRTIIDTERTINIATEAYDTLREMENDEGM